jgi:DNA primase catalytic subunit
VQNFRSKSKTHFCECSLVMLIQMSKYILPKGMRPASLEERRQFYVSEFDLEKVASWFQGGVNKTKFAVIIGRHTKIFPEEYREDAETTIIIDEYSALEDVRKQIVEFLPEGVYYDRNIYDEKDRLTGQELAFDVDPENIVCPVHGTLADKMKRGQGLGFCDLELEMAKRQASGLYEFLEKQFTSLCIVYSGRGFHIHVFDQDAYALNTTERIEMAEDVKSKGFDIDKWVTEGEMHLIRLPNSLHGMVSRIAIPIEKNEIENFDPISNEKCIPKFLQGEKSATSFS